jgi:hypothetical protein
MIRACVSVAGCLAALAPVRAADPLPAATGYRGIWYMNQPTGDEFKYKYSGGMATYPQQHVPIAVYAREVNKTFFVYGGRSRDKNELLHMVSYYDHKTGTVPRPRVLLDKKTADAHDNPTLQIDDRGHLWVFSPSHGTARPSYIHRSVRPYSIDAYERVWEGNFSYPQPWHLPGTGFLFLHTKYKDGRGLVWATSPDGVEWSGPHRLAKVEMGDYQVSWRHGGKVGTAFDYHPRPAGLNARTNLYYLETADAGKTWATAAGRPVTLPLTDSSNPALVRDYRAEGKLVYLKDLNFDRDGRPVVLYLTASGYEPGPKGGPREWFTARWTGAGWEVRPFATSDHNYDHGSLYVEPDGTWRVIAPTAAGPQPFGTGGEMVLWVSRDQGRTWETIRQLTRGSRRNHTYSRRPVDAHPDFYALWADGDAFGPSGSALYFCDRAGRVRRLPAEMAGDTATPEDVR